MPEMEWYGPCLGLGIYPLQDLTWKMSLNQLHFGRSFYTCSAPPLEREKPFADQEQESLGILLAIKNI
ncbi:hypothetical protein NC652_029860 [Populus alba x Populus x berolinensis]|nr:hypothetical protein NC652_029860 [Populus alba x Populus x berolinensis]